MHVHKKISLALVIISLVAIIASLTVGYIFNSKYSAVYSERNDIIDSLYEAHYSKGGQPLEVCDSYIDSSGIENTTCYDSPILAEVLETSPEYKSATERLEYVTRLGSLPNTILPAGGILLSLFTVVFFWNKKKSNGWVKVAVVIVLVFVVALETLWVQGTCDGLSCGAFGFSLWFWTLVIAIPTNIIAMIILRKGGAAQANLLK